MHTTPRRRLALAGALAALGLALLSGCGQGDSGRPIPAAAARDIVSRLDQVERKVKNHSCTSVRSDTLPALQSEIDGLPDRVDAGVRSTLDDGLSRLEELVRAECKPARKRPQSTPTPTPTPSTSSTPDTTPTPSTPEPSQPTEPSTPQTPQAPSGGDGSGDSGGDSGNGGSGNSSGGDSGSGGTGNGSGGDNGSGGGSDGGGSTTPPTGNGANPGGGSSPGPAENPGAATPSRAQGAPA